MVNGLSTEEALRRLTVVLENLPLKPLRDNTWWFNNDHSGTLLYALIFSFFYLFSIISIVSASVILWICFRYFGGDFFILLSAAVLLVFNSFVFRRRCISFNRRLHIAITALRNDISDLLDRILLAKSDFSTSGFYPHFDIPPDFSSFHWVFRDGHAVLLPIYLLVDGDVLLLKPGQIVHAHCFLMEPGETPPEFTPGTIYAPLLEDYPSVSSCSVSPTPLTFPSKAVVVRSPFQDLVEQYYSFYADNNTPLRLSFDYSINLILRFSVILKLTLFALYLMLIVILTGLVFRRTSSLNASASLAASFLFSLGRFAFTLSYLDFTFTWLCALGVITASWERLYYSLRCCPPHYSSFESIPSSHLSSASLASVGYNSKSTVHQTRGFSQGLFKQFWHYLLVLPNPTLERMVITLASVSSVCCVDQQGILSHPVPTAEKVFFFHKRRRRHHRHHQHELQNHCGVHQSVSCNVKDPDPPHPARRGTSSCHRDLHGFEACSSLRSSLSVDVANNRYPNFQPASAHGPRACLSGSVRSDVDLLPPSIRPTAVVLNLRTESYWPYLPYFEQPRWIRYIASLKPIGLSAMLNNCHSAVGQSRNAITDNLRLRVATMDDSLPEAFGIPPFCLCGLARQIGFRPTAIDGYSLDSCIGMYQLGVTSLSSEHPGSRFGTSILHEAQTPSEVPKDSFMKLSANTRVLNSCFATVYRMHTASGYYQLLSQGSANLLASLCSDLWDGREVSPMRYAERHALLDFYNRSASASFCVAFSYSPLLTRPSLELFTQLQPISLENQTICDTILLRLSQENRASPTVNSISVTERCALLPGSNCLRPASVQLPLEITLEPSEITPLSSVTPSPALKSNVYASTRLGAWGNVSKCLSAPSSRTPGRIFNRSSSASLRYSRGTSRIMSRRADASVDSYFEDVPRTNGASSKDTCDPTDLKSLCRNHIFLGLVSLQYQANYTVIDSIRRLNQACIRFVYFSRENELRSRVFAERLGLECGWNCHISLATPVPQGSRKMSCESISSPDPNPSPGVGSPNSSHQRPLIREDKNVHLRRCGSIPLIVPSPSPPPKHVHTSRSLPAFTSLIKHGTPPSKLPPNASLSKLDRPDMINPDVIVTNSDVLISYLSTPPPPPIAHVSSATGTISESSDNGSSSSSSSHNTRNSEFRLSDYMTDNKSRLPRGIANIRPHLDHVDNVPLQVSLFTDCTSESTREMLAILRQYGEIVCIVVNCYSVDSVRCLSQGDVAIAVRPILPRPCTIFTGPSANSASRMQQFSLQTPMNCGTLKRRNCRSFTSCIRATKRWSTADPDSVPLASIITDRKTQSPHSSVAPALDLAARLFQLFCPWVIDMETQGFRVCEWIHEARTCMNNLFWVLTLNLLIPLSASVLQLILQFVGLPAIPFILDTTWEPNNTTAILWLPLEYIRHRLLPLLDAHLYQYSTSISSSIPESLRIWFIAYVPSYRVGQLIWLVLFVTPVLSLSLLDRQVERTRPLREPPRKRGTALDRKKMFWHILLTTGRFMPSLIVCFVCALGYFLLAPGFNLCVAGLTNHSLALNTSDGVLDSMELLPTCFAKLTLLIDTVQEVVFAQFIIYIVLVSFSYANYGQSIKKFRWSTNPTWCIVASLIIISQFAYTTCRCFLWNPLGRIRAYSILSMEFIILALFWCPVLILVNEFLALKERRLILSEHRLARLYFGTKLGMYSPV